MGAVPGGPAPGLASAPTSSILVASNAFLTLDYIKGKELMASDYKSMIQKLERDKANIEAALASLRALVEGEEPKGSFSKMLTEAMTSSSPDLPKPVKIPLRPGAGTKTGRVWKICDELLEEQGEIPSLNGVMNRGITDGLNAGTINSQYRRWRKHQVFVSAAPSMVSAKEALDAIRKTSDET